MTWQLQERVELIMGKIFPMSAPNTPHQSLAIDLAADFKNYFTVNVQKRTDYCSGSFVF
jgi:Uma2 family endonuclease